MSDAQRSTPQQQNSAWSTSATFFDDIDAGIRFGNVAGGGPTQGFIEIAMIFDDQKGKEPVKGQQRYNWDDALKVMISIETSYQIAHQLRALDAGEISEFIVSTGRDGNKTLSFSRGIFDLEGADENLTLIITDNVNSENEDDQVYATYVMTNESIQLGLGADGSPVLDAETNEPKEFKVCPEYLFLVDWVKAIPKAAIDETIVRRVAKAVGGGTGGSSSARPTAAARKMPARRGAKTTTAATQEPTSSSAVSSVLDEED